MIVTAVPAVPIVGVKLVMVGAPCDPPEVTRKFVLLVAEPVSIVTPIGPVVAPAGTLATSCVDEADVTVAGTPLNVTVFSPTVAPKPVP